MFSLFGGKKSLIGSDLLRGGIDNHSHLLYGVDDGVRTLDESLSILSRMEETGLRRLWLTPHIMEDVPNTTEGLRERFERLKGEEYKGGIELRLAAEYMMDNLYEERLAAGDLLLHGEDRVLVETSTMAPPMDLFGTLRKTLSKGYRPVLAHPERYHYMRESDYRRLRQMGILFQLNLPSLIGYYGPAVQAKAQDFLGRGWYEMTGSDCHRESMIARHYEEKALKTKTVALLRPLMDR